MSRRFAARFVPRFARRAWTKTSAHAAVFKRLPYGFDLVLLCLLLTALALGVVTLTTSKAAQVLAHARATLHRIDEAKVGVKRTYLAENAYQEYAPTLVRLNPGVSFTVKPGTNQLEIAINDEELYPDLMMALHTVQSFKPSVGWEMVEFCIHKCHSDTVIARAVIKGFTQEIE